MAAPWLRTLARRNSLFLAGIIVTAIAAEQALDAGIDAWWRTHNAGLLWPDVHAAIEARRASEDDE